MYAFTAMPLIEQSASVHKCAYSLVQFHTTVSVTVWSTAPVSVGLNSATSNQSALWKSAE